VPDDEPRNAVAGVPLHDRRPVVAALAASGAVHALLVLVAALAVGGSGAGSVPAAPPALRATLATPPQRFVVPDPPAPAPAPQPLPALDEAASARPPAPLALPLPRVVPAQDQSPGEGRAVVHVAADDLVPEPAALASLLVVHPDALRVVPEFEVAPEAGYPAAAIAERRQFAADILAIVGEDGSLALVEGTFEDPIFGASVREALAGAKAVPPQVDGKPFTGWTLLRFYYEYVGSGADAAATPTER
jgi:hypothetical protein